nr:MGMT family protein [Kingella potus]
MFFRQPHTIRGCPAHPGHTVSDGTVWQALQAIPYGKTVSYREQAERIGKPAAVRAVAHANGANRVSVIIPCHRVIGADGSLTGYGGGLQRKQWLLAHERGDAPDNKDLFGESLF